MEERLVVADGRALTDLAAVRQHQRRFVFQKANLIPFLTAQDVLTSAAQRSGRAGGGCASCSAISASRTAWTLPLSSSPADNNSASPSPGRWRTSRPPPRRQATAALGQPSWARRDGAVPAHRSAGRWRHRGDARPPRLDGLRAPSRDGGRRADTPPTDGTVAPGGLERDELHAATEGAAGRSPSAALKVIAERGLNPLPTQAIAAEIGVTDDMLRHFASKEDIVLAALDRVEERLFERLPPEDARSVGAARYFFRFDAVCWARPSSRGSFSEELPHAAGPRGARQVESWKQRSR